VGGQFNGANSINGVTTRNRLAALDVTTGIATAWDPNANDTVNTLVVDGSTVYVGGIFTTINGATTRNHIAALSATTGTATAWDPNANDIVNTLAVSGSTVYVGGQFNGANSINGATTRNRIAALSATTGTATAWDPNANNIVSTLVVNGSTVYVGGQFNGANSIGGQTRNHIAALSAATGTATAWDPNADSTTVFALVVSGSTIYVGGNFFNIGGQERHAIAALDATTGLATAWAPDANGVVNSLVVSGSTVYAGGNFSFIGGVSRNRFAVFGPAAEPTPVPAAAPRDVPESDTLLLLGGGMAGLGTWLRYQWSKRKRASQ
jgi:hypothetical protein